MKESGNTPNHRVGQRHATGFTGSVSLPGYLELLLSAVTSFVPPGTFNVASQRATYAR